MAISIVQTIQYDDAAIGDPPTRIKSGITTTAGNRLVLAIAARDTYQPTSITDSASNTWTKIVAGNGNSSDASIWATGAASAITSYTIHFDFGNSANGIQTQLFELQNADNGAADVTNNATGSSTSPSSGSSGTPIGPADVAIGVISLGFIFSDNTFSSNTFTSGAGTENARTARSGFTQGCTGSLILSSTTAQTYSATITSAGWAAATALFKPQPPTFRPPNHLRPHIFSPGLAR